MNSGTDDGDRNTSVEPSVNVSKGRNPKEHRSDFVLCEYETRPDVDLSEWDIQQVRAVHKRGEWRLQFVCRTTIDPEPPGNGVAGIDLGICNFAAVSFGGESLLYPGGAFKEDEYYFAKKRAECDDSFSREAQRLDRKRTDRRTHFLHTLSKEIVAKCVKREVGTIVVGDLHGICEDENGEPTNWGDHGNMDLHGWAFDRFTTLLDYKAEAEGIEVEPVSERDTSKSCSVCGRCDDSQRVERGLYVCDECGLVANADSNGAENIRQKVLPNLQREDRDNGWMAQPVVRLFDKTRGDFLPREQMDREP